MDGGEKQLPLVSLAVTLRLYDFISGPCSVPQGRGGLGKELELLLLLMGKACSGQTRRPNLTEGKITQTLFHSILILFIRLSWKPRKPR